MNGYTTVGKLCGKPVFAHRVVAARCLGHPLLPDEVVHHINRDRTDYRPENLQVVPRKIHSLAHALRASGPLLIDGFPTLAEEARRQTEMCGWILRDVS